MPTTLQQLTQLAAPPQSEPGRLDWLSVERSLGTALPADYKELIATYGSGFFDGFLTVYHPTIENEHLNLIANKREVLWAERHVAEEDPGECPYSLTDEDGLVPWGRTIDGDDCYWIRENRQPSEWIIVVRGRQIWDWVEFDGNLTEFLLALLTKSFICSVFPEFFPSSDPGFSPTPETITAL